MTFVPLSFIGGHFFLFLGTGLALLFPFLGVRQIGRSYHQWNHVFVAVFLCLAVWLTHLSPYWGVVGALYLMNGFVFGLPVRMRFLATFTEILLILACAYGFYFEFLGSTAWAHWNFISTALLLGSVSIALIVGHWYLVATGLSFGYLKCFVWFLLIAIVLRAFVVVIGHLDGHIAWSPSWGLWSDFFFWVRILVGLVVPLLFTTMALGSLRYHNNQSATGILYGALLMIYMGELIQYVIIAPPPLY